MPDLQRLIDDYIAADKLAEQNREDRATYAAFDRGQFIAAEQRGKFLTADLARAKDALCKYMVEHRDEFVPVITTEGS